MNYKKDSSLLSNNPSLVPGGKKSGPSCFFVEPHAEASFDIPKEFKYILDQTKFDAATVPEDEISLEYKGFVISEELVSQEITMPTKISEENLNSLILQWPDSDLKRGIPEVRPRGENSKPEAQEPFSYHMYAYKRVGPSIDEEGQFVFTSASPGLGISTNTFIPLNTLKTRLNGNKNERLNAYALDWKIAQGTHFNKCDSYYLGLRDSIGKPSKDYHFLKYLLGDEKETTRGLDIPSLIFKRWCAVAYVASKLAKNKWAVKARFWAFPSKVDLEITFFYKIGNFEIGNDNEYTALKYAILNAHEKAKNEVGKLEEGFESKVSYPKIEFLDDCKDLNGDNLESLGSHPQNFYKVFVTTSDAKKMEQNGYSFLVLDSPDPPSIHSPKRSQINKIPTENKGDTTTTLITNAKVKSVNDWPRCITQNAIMGGISAAEAAVEIWGGISPPRTFEWLHRSAYSYGGIEDGSPDSSQTPGNIVLGTYGANTSMIRYENYLKRLANDGKNVKLQTKKIQNMEIEDTDPISSWFFKFLEYTWTFPIPPNSYQILSHPGAFKQSHTFNLFSKQIPTRFEVETDEAFDAQWLGKEKNPKLEAAIYSVLEARREK